MTRRPRPQVRRSRSAERRRVAQTARRLPESSRAAPPTRRSARSTTDPPRCRHLADPVAAGGPRRPHPGQGAAPAPAAPGAADRRRGPAVAASARTGSRPRPPAIAASSLLGEAKALFNNGNYPAASSSPTEAKAGKFGVDAQADELIAQIDSGRAGRALSLYEDGPGGHPQGRQRPGPHPA